MRVVYFATDHGSTSPPFVAPPPIRCFAAGCGGGGGGGGGNQSVMAWHAAGVLPLDTKPANIATTWMLCHQGDAFEVTRFG